MARALAKITGGHHGTFPTSADLSVIRARTLGADDWERAREALLRALARALFGEDLEGAAPILCPLDELIDPAIVPLLGGLISVADWIGSSHHFPPAGPMPVARYVSLSCHKAAEAVEDFGWSEMPRFARPAARTWKTAVACCRHWFRASARRRLDGAAIRRYLSAMRSMTC